MNRTFLPAGGIVLLLTWLSRPLLDAWANAPYDRWGWVALVLWLIPLFVSRPAAPAPARLIAAAALTVIALVLGELLALVYVSLAVALSAFLPRHRLAWLWLLTALSWMPVSGYIASRYFHLSPGPVLILRLFSAAAGSLAFLTFRAVPARSTTAPEML